MLPGDGCIITHSKESPCAAPLLITLPDDDGRIPVIAVTGTMQDQYLSPAG